MKDEQLHKDALWIYLPFLWLKVFVSWWGSSISLHNSIIEQCCYFRLYDLNFSATNVGKWNWKYFIPWVRNLRFILILESKFACIQSDGFIYSHLFENKFWVPSKGNTALSIRKRLEPLGFNLEKNRHSSCHRGPFAG
jgi:hypothetical protein